jgi:hypothetical protein
MCMERKTINIVLEIREKVDQLSELILSFLVITLLELHLQQYTQFVRALNQEKAWVLGIAACQGLAGQHLP